MAKRVTVASIARRSGIEYLTVWRFLTGGLKYPDPADADAIERAREELENEFAAVAAHSA